MTQSFLLIGRDEAIAYSTVILAVAAVGALIANVLLARSTRRSVTILEQQLQEDRRRAFPRLRADFPTPYGPDFDGKVTYVGGGEPAFRVEVVLRFDDRYWTGLCDPIHASSPVATYRAQPCDAATANSAPLAGWPFGADDEDGVVVAVRWQGALGGQAFAARRYRRDASRGFVSDGPLLSGGVS